MTARTRPDSRTRGAAGRRASGGRPGVVGVLGGMGPLATADFYTKLVRLTPAACDQDHLHVIIDSNPQIPDRTTAVLSGGPDPTPALVAAARRLERAGATLIVIPCNSAHAFLRVIRRAVGVPVLDIMDEVAAAAAGLTPAPRAAGLLATTATLRMRLYHAAFGARGIAILEPGPDEQLGVMTAIHAVKAGDLGATGGARLRDVAEALVRRGAQALVLGCTELPLIVDPASVSVPVLDGSDLLARAVLRETLGGAAPGGEFPPPSRRSDRSHHDHHARSAAPVRRT